MVSLGPCNYIIYLALQGSGYRVFRFQGLGLREGVRVFRVLGYEPRTSDHGEHILCSDRDPLLCSGFPKPAGTISGCFLQLQY